MGSGSELHLRQTRGVFDVFPTVAGLRHNARYLSSGAALLAGRVVSEDE